MDISRVSLKFFVKIYFRLYERGVSPPLRHLANYYPRARLEGTQLFHINVLKTAGPTRQHLSWPAFFFGYVLQVLFHYVWVINLKLVRKYRIASSVVGK